VAAAAAAAAAAEGSAHQYGDLYPTYNTYLMNRYSDQRYHTPPSYTTSGYSTASHISAHASETGYYRYPDYSRYPYSGGNPSGPTSPRWRRRSYDPDYISTRRTNQPGVAVSSGAPSTTRPLSDLASSIANTSNTSTSSVLMRSRSRSRVSDYDPNAYLRYMSPASAASYATSTRPMSSYIYGHSYNPSTTIHNSSELASGSVGGVMSGTRMGSVPPQAPPNYNAMDREVSARVRRYQADPNS
jgi:hypothetical protein